MISANRTSSPLLAGPRAHCDVHPVIILQVIAAQVSLARLFNSANARPAKRPSLIAVEVACVVEPAGEIMDLRRQVT